MDTIYRVVDELVTENLRIYGFAAIGRSRLVMTRSCESSKMPFVMGGTYTQSEIDEHCPEAARTAERAVRQSTLDFDRL